MFRIKLQRPDKSGLKLGKEVKWTAEKSNVSANRLSAGKTGDRLVDNGLEDGGRQILFRGAVVDQRLNIGFCKNAAAGSDGIKSLIILRIFV